ncbi:helix-turn-helix domain-containing protein [Amycolatopsis sp.]|uniref:helix-turn-helix domain-containing protein n=1 Tax=Amycolatopsis sp. TaxID=37632 RepID=UPI00345AFE67
MVVALEYRSRVAGRGQGRAPITATAAHLGLTTDRVADRLGCSARSVRRMIHDGSLPARRVGPLWIVDEADVRNYAARRPA